MASGQIFSKQTQALFYNYKQLPIQRMLDFDFLCGRETPSVAGIINPGSEGFQKLFFGQEEIAIPVHSSIKEACKAHSTADVFINFASFRSAFASSMDALKQPTIRVVAIIAEGVPEGDTKKLIAYARANNKIIIGPATVGGIQAGAFKIGDTAGTLENIVESKLYRPGSVGFVSKSGGMSNELYRIISRTTDGIYEGIAIGGDVFPGSTLSDHVLRYQNIPQIKMVVVLGELGGRDEYSLVEALKQGRVTKPVVAWVSGTCARLFKSEVQFGHAGAKSGGDMESAQAKNSALQGAGALVPTSFEGLEPLIKEVYTNLVEEGVITPIPDFQPPPVPQDLNAAIKAGKVRAPTHIISTICDDRGEEATYAGVRMSSLIESDKGVGDVISLLWFKRSLPSYCTKFIEMCIMLCADHGPCVSGAHNTIVTARAGKDLVSSLVSGLLTIGPRFGGAIDDAARYFKDACDKGLTPYDYVEAMKKKGIRVPGIGHRIKSADNRDKRVELLTNYGRTFLPIQEIFDRPGQESKLELFGFDSLVNILGLRSMAGQQVAAPTSPRDGEDVAITLGERRHRDAKLGTMMGVFVPCLQNILGIIFYIRFSWIVGIAGVWHSLLLISLCCICTCLTGLSLSAIATNGAMKGGGPYYLIGRALGPEVGVSIGLCFFLGNAIAASLYILGAVETFMDALPGAGIFKASVTEVLAPSASGAGTEAVNSPNLHDLQVYGVLVTVVLCLIVFGGVKMINKVAPAFLIPVLVSVLLIFIGIFAAGRQARSGITGLHFSTLKDNWEAEYQRTNRAGIPSPDGITYWGFDELLGLFFPAVTGIMAGSNRSASLRDTQRSIPKGTLSAIGATTALYLISCFMFGAVATREELLTNRLLTATLAWPVPAVVHIGIILSTLGAALQSLTGAPRLLAAIANDDILPVLKYFKAPDSVEPHLATLFTMLICAGCVVIGNLDLITPVITMFFLMCYGGVNLSCFLLDLLDAPSWRPRWKFHHWSLSLVGALICLLIMFLISWVFTVISLALASLLYYYVSIKGKGGDWGDGFKSAYFQLALRSLRTLGANQVHPKNWYPIPLIFCRPWGSLPEDVPCHPKLADFANCMKKKGRGMSIFLSIMDGDYRDKAEEARHACKLLSTYIDYKNCEGVGEIVVAKNMREGFRGAVQTMGLGNLKPNIVVMRYPEIWREEDANEIPENFVSIINDCITANKAVVIVKGLDEWPGEFQKQYGTIDLYWIVRDGGLMLLLSQLLRSKESFESCKIQVFCIAEEDTSAEELKADVRKFLYDLRMQAEVIVVNMKSWEAHQEDQEVKMGKGDAMEALSKARKRIHTEEVKIRESGHIQDQNVALNEQQVNKFLYTTLTLNSIILRHSRMAAVVLVSLPPPPLHHPAFCYMEYMDLLVESVPRLLVVRGYRRDVVTIFT